MPRTRAACTPRRRCSSTRRDSALVEVGPAAVDAVGRADHPRDERHRGSRDEPPRLDRDPQVPRAPPRGPRGCRARAPRATAPARRTRRGVRRRGRASRTGSPWRSSSVADECERAGGSRAATARPTTVWLPTSNVNPATRRPTCRQWATSAAASSGRTPKLGERSPFAGNASRTSTATSGRPRNFATSEVLSTTNVRMPRRYAPVMSAIGVTGWLCRHRAIETPARSRRSISQREATAKLAPNASIALIGGGVGERAGREVDGDVGKLVAQGQQLRGHAVGVEHEQGAAVPRTRPSRSMRSA